MANTGATGNNPPAGTKPATVPATTSTPPQTVPNPLNSPSLQALRQSSNQDGFIDAGSIINDIGFTYQSASTAASEPIYNEMLSKGSTTKQMHGAYGRLGNVYQQRTELNNLALVRSEIETFIKTLPLDQQEAVRSGRFDFPQSFIKRMNDMGYKTEDIFTAADKRMTIPNITKLIENTYRSEYHMKQILKNLADNLAWWVKDFADSAKIDPNYRG